MKLIDSLKMAWRALVGNKLRSALTMLGIIIGVAAVIALVSLGNGVQDFVTKRMQSIGSNLLFVSPGALSDAGGGAAASLLASDRAILTMNDVEAVLNHSAAPHVAAISPELNTVVEVAYGGESQRVSVAGVWPNYFSIRNLQLAYGALITQRDNEAEARVCVLGPSIAKDLFGAAYPIGKRVRIKGAPFTVIGVLEKKGGGAFGNMDSYVYIPLLTAQARIFPLRGSHGEMGVSLIYAQATDEKDMSQAVQEITEIIRRQHRIGIGEKDDFSVISQADITAIFGDITGVLTAFLGAIAGISLLVGGIGIMNIMLVSVTERTREIGIRKAIGAKKRDIMMQFLVEAIFLALVGGLLGVALGWTLAVQVTPLLQGVKPVMTLQTIVIAVGVSAAVGVFFGIYPARRAASLNPIDALRYE